MGEVNASFEQCRNCFVLAELFAVVDRDGKHLVRTRSQQLNKFTLYFRRFFGGELAQQREFGFAFGAAEDRPVMARANDGVSFPVTDTALASHDRWPLIDTGTVGNLGLPGATAITFALFLLTPQVSIQGATAQLIDINVLIDPFRTDGRLVLEPQTTMDLFRTPLLLQ